MSDLSNTEKEDIDRVLSEIKTLDIHNSIIKNIVDAYINDDINTTRDISICNTFIWSSTKQGIKYWRNINNSGIVPTLKLALYTRGIVHYIVKTHYPETTHPEYYI